MYDILGPQSSDLAKSYSYASSIVKSKAAVLLIRVGTRIAGNIYTQEALSGKNIEDSVHVWETPEVHGWEYKEQSRPFTMYKFIRKDPPTELVDKSPKYPPEERREGRPDPTNHYHGQSQHLLRGAQVISYPPLAECKGSRHFCASVYRDARQQKLLSSVEAEESHQRSFLVVACGNRRFHQISKYQHS